MDAEPASTNDFAQVKDVPSDEYLCIEFPGYVKNFDKVLETFGGIESIKSVHSTKQNQMPVHLRPNDTWSHPIFLDRCLTTNFVLEVTQTIDPISKKVTSVEGEIVGQVPHTYTFRGLADFQYLPSRLTEPIVEPAAEKSVLNESHVKDHWPPPIYSKSDHPHLYNFDSPQCKHELFRNSNGTTERRFVKSQKKAVVDHRTIPVFQFDVESVPLIAPLRPPDVHISGELIYRFQMLFAEHPIWSRHMLLSHVPPLLKNSFIPALHQVAYSFSNGPWRLSWIKLAYDPRNDPEARKYQILDCKFSEDELRGKLPEKWSRVPTNKPRRVTTTKRKINSPEAANVEEQEQVYQSQTLNELKFLKPPSRTRVAYSLQDMELEGLDELIAAKPSETCTKDQGWFTNETIKAIRALIKKRLQQLLVDWDNGNLPARLQEDQEMIQDQFNDQEEDEDDDFGLGTDEEQEEAFMHQSMNFIHDIHKSVSSGTRVPATEKIATGLSDDLEEPFELIGEDDES